MHALAHAHMHACIPGPSIPLPLEMVEVAAISHNFALIEWEVPFVSFTPETYFVRYGPTDSDEFSDSEILSSGDDFLQEDSTYTVVLNALTLGTEYQFVVMASNSEGIVMSEQGNFTTRSSGELQLSGMGGSGELQLSGMGGSGVVIPTLELGNDLYFCVLALTSSLHSSS